MPLVAVDPRVLVGKTIQAVTVEAWRCHLTCTDGTVYRWVQRAGSSPGPFFFEERPDEEHQETQCAGHAGEQNPGLSRQDAPQGRGGSREAPARAQ